MAEKTPSQVIVNTEADSSLQKIYPSTYQSVPPLTGSTSIYINPVTENIYNNYVINNDNPAGNTTEVQFNLNNHMTGDTGFTYNYVTDSLTITGNVITGHILTDNILYANGIAWNFSGGSYSNSNVASYLPTYTGNITANRVNATLFTGSGAGLTSVPSASLVGDIPTANYANFAGTVTTSAQPNITSTGTLTSLTVTGNVTSGNIKSDHLLYSNGVAWSFGSTYSNSNVGSYLPTYSGLIGGTLSTGAQPNVTSLGSLIGLTVSNATGVVNFTTTANVTLGAVSNLHISGGTSGEYLSTNGSGTLSWSTPGTGNLQVVTTSGNTTDKAISITNSTSSTNYNTGALKVSGGVGVGENLHALGHISSVTTVYAGLYADFSSYTYPKFVGRDAGAQYIQGALVNTTDTGSADWVAYGDTSDETQGWSDFGYCGSNFNDPAYSITKPNDGYFFVQGMDAIAGGNMVLATGGYGTNHDIVFATGGFSSSREIARFHHNSDVTQSQLEVLGSVSIAKFLTLQPTTAPGSPTEGTVYYDSTAHKLKVYTGSSWETITSA